MMPFTDLSNLGISVEKQGPTAVAKASFPLRYGRYSEIRTADYEFVFNLNGEIKFIRGLHQHWPHPAEQLKRTAGNDWVYYSVGDQSGDGGVISWMGEYYLPCLPYPSNAVWEIDYRRDPRIMGGFASWAQLYANLYGAKKERFHPKARDLIGRILEHGDGELHERGKRLKTIIDAPVSVLPPDTRHLDYEVIPVIIADGCLYHCDFCCVKSENRYKVRSMADILDQIRRLATFHGRDLGNYRGVFLGNHDALAAGDERIAQAALAAGERFQMEKRAGSMPSFFLFGSVDSLLNTEGGAFERLDGLPFHTYINIGFESIHGPTLQAIGKPLDPEKVARAFRKMAEINNTHENVEITGNFLMGADLPSEHYRSLADLLGDGPAGSRGKGAVYLSPLKDSPKKRELLPLFQQIKEHSRWPVYIYLIQRL